MPTAAKLVAALCLAALGFAVSEVIKTILPASIDFGAFSLVNAALGFVLGWVVMGKRAGRGMSAAISNGFTGMAALVLWGLFIQGVNEMVDLAMSRRYDGPFEALVAIFQIMTDYAGQMLDLKVITLLLVGGIIAGVLTEIAAKRWR
ncbi:TrgA family protein [Thetidibacter halocola]|uniref:TrgA family protein n=1 Tax=Thetidibacter halocola TaxID=2827239 RepID=A0A8J7WA75_9RHOB|nr:TrgA family protein [Thetidibacter halocola]MBS0123057.1 TrgA family protein [Thetidibacter halocola]